ncbi:hypothetical protein FIBSPDRAFT_858077, partial [Athelia psychrophila]
MTERDTRKSCAGLHPTSPTSKRPRTSQYPSPTSRSHAHSPTPAPVSASSLPQYHAKIDAFHPLFPSTHQLLSSLANPKDITELTISGVRGMATKGNISHSSCRRAFRWARWRAERLSA